MKWPARKVPHRKWKQPKRKLCASVRKSGGAESCPFDSEHEVIGFIFPSGFWSCFDSVFSFFISPCWNGNVYTLKYCRLEACDLYFDFIVNYN